MKKVILRLVIFTMTVLTLAVSGGNAQDFEVTAIGMYQFGGLVDETTQEGGVFTYGEALGIGGSGGFGLVVNYRVGARTVLEASWDLQPSSLNHHVPDTVTGTRSVSEISDLGVQYYMIGLIYDWSRTGTRPYIGGAVGAVRLVPDEGYATETHPCFSTILGCKWIMSNTVFLQTRGRLTISKIPKGSLFFDEYLHHKETFMPQVQIGAGIGISL